MPAINTNILVQDKLTVSPVDSQATKKKGRIPRKPNLPLLSMSDSENSWIEYQMYIYNLEYDLSESDQIQLHLLAVEYVKYMRTIAWELENDQQITMAKQHPGTRYDALIDRLGLHQAAQDVEAGN